MGALESEGLSDRPPDLWKLTISWHSFPGDIVKSEYFKDKKAVLARLTDLAIWQSNYEVYAWNKGSQRSIP
ncbi:hypothetical protein BDR03DRAFT_1017555 [Suillus americanus]|nr:hypothetical protein BDR03DRAFT_1017555 [Suillus americanus]